MLQIDDLQELTEFELENIEKYFEYDYDPVYYFINPFTLETIDDCYNAGMNLQNPVNIPSDFTCGAGAHGEISTPYMDYPQFCVCSSGYLMNSAQNECVSCQNIDASCTACSSDGCEECTLGMMPTYDKSQCIPKFAGC